MWNSSVAPANFDATIDWKVGNAAHGKAKRRQPAYPIEGILPAG